MTTIRQTAIVVRPEVHAVAARPAAQVTSVRSVVALSPPGTGAQTRQLLTVAEGQTVFTLPSTPTQPHLSQLYLNGVKSVYGTEYAINTTILTWLGVALTHTDILEIVYR